MYLYIDNSCMVLSLSGRYWSREEDINHQKSSLPSLVLEHNKSTDSSAPLPLDGVSLLFLLLSRISSRLSSYQFITSTFWDWTTFAVFELVLSSLHRWRRTVNRQHHKVLTRHLINVETEWLWCWWIISFAGYTIDWHHTIILETTHITESQIDRRERGTKNNSKTNLYCLQFIRMIMKVL